MPRGARENEAERKGKVSFLLLKIYFLIFSIRMSVSDYVHGSTDAHEGKKMKLGPKPWSYSQLEAA